MKDMQKATFAAGCFWGVEDFFRAIPGVSEAFSGYTGGTVENPTYEQVCTGTTGHAEGVEVTFDEAQVPYEKLLQVFFENHNPTTKDRQGPDIGHQYRSVVFYHDDAQKVAAEKMIADLSRNRAFGNKEIVTEVVPAQTFWKAEEYHQRYLEKHGLGSCHV